MKIIDLDNPEVKVLAIAKDLSWVDLQLKDGRIVGIRSDGDLTEYEDYDDWWDCITCK
jgi:hypothetical protein